MSLLPLLRTSRVFLGASFALGSVLIVSCGGGGSSTGGSSTGGSQYASAIGVAGGGQATHVSASLPQPTTTTLSAVLTPAGRTLPPGSLVYAAADDQVALSVYTTQAASRLLIRSDQASGYTSVPLTSASGVQSGGTYRYDLTLKLASLTGLKLGDGIKLDVAPVFSTTKGAPSARDESIGGYGTATISICLSGCEAPKPPFAYSGAGYACTPNELDGHDYTTDPVGHPELIVGTYRIEWSSAHSAGTWQSEMVVTSQKLDANSYGATFQLAGYATGKGTASASTGGYLGAQMEDAFGLYNIVLARSTKATECENNKEDGNVDEYIGTYEFDPDSSLPDSTLSPDSGTVRVVKLS